MNPRKHATVHRLPGLARHPPFAIYGQHLLLQVGLHNPPGFHHWVIPQGHRGQTCVGLVLQRHRCEVQIYERITIHHHEGLAFKKGFHLFDPTTRPK